MTFSRCFIINTTTKQKFKIKFLDLKHDVVFFLHPQTSSFTLALLNVRTLWTQDGCWKNIVACLYTMAISQLLYALHWQLANISDLTNKTPCNNLNGRGDCLQNKIVHTSYHIKLSCIECNNLFNFIVDRSILWRTNL